ncbi:uncharacterized protein LOC131627879 [Vicia villosa]|uniref:uncharacterized protein LOC131627879 n=1 Tax=Vicia villosa TaxID=3911 RepID=UPI00273C7C9C|nr:uncharacterized protein LOC131627879 [Vicia villosa]
MSKQKVVFSLEFREDSWGPLRLASTTSEPKLIQTEDSSSEDIGLGFGGGSEEDNEVYFSENVLSNGSSSTDCSVKVGRTAGKRKGKSISNDPVKDLSRQTVLIETHSTFDSAVKKAKDLGCLRTQKVEKGFSDKDNSFFKEGEGDSASVGTSVPETAFQSGSNENISNRRVALRKDRKKLRYKNLSCFVGPRKKQNGRPKKIVVNSEVPSDFSIKPNSDRLPSFSDPISQLSLSLGSPRRGNQMFLGEHSEETDIISLPLKRVLWRNLLALKDNYNDGEWVLGGDFNSVKNGGERKGRSVVGNQAEWEEFSGFINDLGLEDVPCKGKKFSWFSSDDWGPKPFKFNNEWFQHKEFFGFVEKEWMGLDVNGRGDFVLKEKLRLLKNKLRWWNINVFGKINLELEEGVKEINALDNLSSEEEADSGSRWRANRKFWTNLKIKENMLIQKARLKWLNDGDDNSRYFHTVMKRGLRRNYLGHISSTNGIISKVEEVKEVIFEHLESKFKESVEPRPGLDGDIFNKLNLEDKNSLEVPFEENEIKEAAWSCDGSKSPGPDGYSILFYKKCWEIVKSDVISCFRELHSGSCLSKSITSSFLALIPKSNNPLGLDEYRPIYLVGSILKSISKVLAGRIKKVIGKVISNSQSAFVPGRQLLDGVLVANELVDFSTKEKKEVLLFKVDFEKAYDKVNWEFLRTMMRKMGFGEIWIRWMNALAFTSHMSVLVNGSPTKEFKVEKGLRQGDPISPFLFVIVVEGLKGLVNKAVENGDFAGFTFNRRCSKDVLQFADDTLLVGDVITFWRLPPTFLGLPIGSNPRRITTWEPLVAKVKKRLASWKGRFLSFGGRITLIKSVLSSLAIFYLSFYKAPKKVIKDINRIQSNFLWGGTEDKKCIHWVSWDSMCLPIEKGGLGIRRIEDFNSALLFKWKWRIVDKPYLLWYGVLKARYGDNNLKVAHVGTKEKGEEAKSYWWRDGGISCNGGSTSFWHSNWTNRGPLKDSYPQLYRNSALQDVSVALMGNGIDGIWKWGDFGISRPIPNSNQRPAALYNAEAITSLPLNAFSSRPQHCEDQNFVSAQGNLILDDNSIVPSLVEQLKHDLASSFEESNIADSVLWLLDIEGKFTVRSCYGSLIRRQIPYGPEGEFDKALKLVWKMKVPMKSKAFGWRSFINKLPTRGALFRKGVIPSPNVVCAFCRGIEETTVHLLLSCHCVDLVWRDIAEWIGFDNFKAGDIKESFLRWYNFSRKARVRKGKEGVVWLAVVWHIWLVRNGIVFRGDSWNISDIVWGVKALVWRWSFVGKIMQFNCNFYEFSRDPIFYLS